MHFSGSCDGACHNFSSNIIMHFSWSITVVICALAVVSWGYSACAMCTRSIFIGTIPIVLYLCYYSLSACISRVQANSVIIMLSMNNRSRKSFICVSNRPSFVVVHAFHHFDGTLPSYLSSSLCTYQPSYVLQQKDCSKFQKQTWKRLVKVLLVTLLWLSGTCRPESFSLPPKFQS